MSDRNVVDAERTADLFVAVLAKALTDRLLDEAFDGQVTSSQLQALRYLLLNEHRLMSDLADGLGISYPAATKTVERLVKKSLVTRESDPADRRVVRVRLTEKGAQLVRDIHAERTRRLSSVLTNLNRTDREALLRGMGAFITSALDCIEDGRVVASICLHCGSEHHIGCPVDSALARARECKEPA